MHEYDIVLKLLLQQSAESMMQALIGASVINWLPIELPKVQNPRVDLLGEIAAGGALIHIELQSNNDPDMPLRMAEYCLGIHRRFSRFPRQIVVYVGSGPLRMPDHLTGPAFSFRYELIDIRALDGEQLLASPQTSDNVMAVLAKLQNERAAMETIVRKIGESDVEQRAFYLQALLTLAGLRNLEELAEEEARKVPILNDILENKVLGREFKRGLQEGREEGRQEGRHEGEVAVLRRQLERRFGVLPDWAEQILAKCSEESLSEVAVRVLDARSLEELLR